MASLCRDIIGRAERWLLAHGAADYTAAAELAEGMAVLQDLLLELPGLDVGGPWIDSDVTADATMVEDGRIRVQDGYTVSITWPNTVPDWTGAPEYFDLTSFTGDYRAPRDGSRGQVIYDGGYLLKIYCADAGEWRQVNSLTADSSVPLPASCHNGLAAMLAERLALGKQSPDGRPVSPAPAVIDMARRGASQIKALLTRRPRVTSVDGPALSRARQVFC